MKMQQQLTTAVILLSCVGTGARLIDLQRYKSLVTLIHNYYRTQERAADMKEMKWDNYLQTRAEEWSENCHWGHQSRGLGENLSFFWSSGPQMDPADIILNACRNWWSEVNQWTWSTSCDPACHYTQMIWGTTERVGCALSKCSTLTMDSGDAQTNADFLVCFYDPPGNYIGRYPYTMGESCTACSPGDLCRNSLCSSPARSEGGSRNTRLASRVVSPRPRVQVSRVSNKTMIPYTQVTRFYVRW